MLHTESLSKWTADGNTAVWLKVPIEQSDVIPIASRQGFVFHHAEADYSMLCTWLSTESQSRLPRFASHQVGVAGMVISILRIFIRNNF